MLKNLTAFGVFFLFGIVLAWCVTATIEIVLLTARI